MFHYLAKLLVPARQLTAGDQMLTPISGEAGLITAVYYAAGFGPVLLRIDDRVWLQLLQEEPVQVLRCLECLEEPRLVTIIV